MKYLDSHCHVHFQAYKDDMDAVVKRALDAGVGLITVGTQSTTSKNAIALAERFDNVWCAIGLHPNHLHVQEFADDEELSPNDPQQTNETVIKTRSEHFDEAYYAELVKHPKVVAIGEFGLDYYHVPPNVDETELKADQFLNVRQQMRFATLDLKPIIIHCRAGSTSFTTGAHADQLQLLKEEVAAGGLPRRGVIHCFTGTADEAAQYHELGFFVSFTGIVTFGKNVMETARQVPLEQMLIETDSPYLSPAPHRGQRNEPANVIYIAETIAKLKGISVDEVARVTTENARRLFDLA